MYSQDKIDVALKVFHQCESVTTTIRVLSYPTRRAFYTWIANEGSVKSERKPLKLVNTAEYPRNPPVERAWKGENEWSFGCVVNNEHWLISWIIRQFNLSK